MPRNNVFQSKSNQNYDSEALKKFESCLISNMAAKVGQVGKICPGDIPPQPAACHFLSGNPFERPFAGRNRHPREKSTYGLCLERTTSKQPGYKIRVPVPPACRRVYGFRFYE